MRRLLHVENDPLVARAVQRLLRIHQYEVGSVLSFEEGRALSGDFHVGVMDVDLGDGDGVDLAKELLDRKVIQHVVFFTARTDCDTETRARAVGPVVGKTAGVEALLQEIAKCFQPQSAASHTRNRVDDTDEDGEGLPRSSSRTA